MRQFVILALIAMAAADNVDQYSHGNRYGADQGYQSRPAYETYAPKQPVLQSPVVQTPYVYSPVVNPVVGYQGIQAPIIQAPVFTDNSYGRENRYYGNQAYDGHQGSYQQPILLAPLNNEGSNGGYRQVNGGGGIVTLSSTSSASVIPTVQTAQVAHKPRPYPTYARENYGYARNEYSSAPAVSYKSNDYNAEKIIYRVNDYTDKVIQKSNDYQRPAYQEKPTSYDTGYQRPVHQEKATTSYDNAYQRPTYHEKPTSYYDNQGYVIVKGDYTAAAQ